jgi:hypothetical protein
MFCMSLAIDFAGGGGAWSTETYPPFQDFNAFVLVIRELSEAVPI